MVYKKYIKRGGKFYGPYIYESKRVDGKVVSQYHGSENKVDFRKYALIFVSVIVLIGLIYFLSSFNFGSLTGFASLNTDVDYSEGQPISGNVVMSLKEGELLPASSKLIFENEGQTYEYNLDELVLEQTVNGNFYIENTGVSGIGEGYGIEGERQIYPEVSFVLNIYPAETSSENPETATPTETTTEEPASEPVIEATETTIETQPEETHPSEAELETQPETTSTEASPITGFFVKAFNFFLSLTPTGRAIDEGNTEISGQASFGNDFVYELSGGEGVQLKPGSVFVNGATVSDETAQVKAEGNQVIVETSYSETENGFGSDYLGSGTKTIIIDLSSLGLVLKEGKLNTRIVYGNEEIISNTLNLIPGTTQVVSEDISNETEVNITIEVPVVVPTVNVTNETIAINPEIQVITAETVGFILTEEEKTILVEEFGDIPLKKTKSEVFNGKLIVRYELGNRWIEYPYDTNMNDEELEDQMSLDRMRWLKDLAYGIKMSKQNTSSTTPVENFSIS